MERESSQPDRSALLAQIDELKAKLKRYEEDETTTQNELATFDALDFDVFSNRNWDRLRESHAPDIIVYWPDGHQTRGIEQHITDLDVMFVYAPDTAIKVHPIRFGREGYTCVTGIMTGTFTEPMPTGNGTFIQPTGKAFSLPMCTVGHWENGVMVEEWLFWDNATYMKQIGMGA
ncbi:MAG TPA: ester cyclase [Armatimonadota bacterium]|nr:ester cyclase [Armatimonadota bacterium]